MKLKMIALCGATLIASSAYGYSSPLDFDIPEKEINVTYCPATGSYPGGIMYTSELLGIKETDEPLYDVLAGKAPHVKEANKFFALIDANDHCDRVGVMYVAKFLAHFWPGTEEAEKNKENIATMLTEEFLTKPKPTTDLIKNARIEARNLVHQQYGLIENH